MWNHPLLPDGMVFIAGKALQAVNAATGQERWRFGRDDQRQKSFISAGPVVAQGLVFIGLASRDGAELIALDAATGQQQWWSA